MKLWDDIREWLDRDAKRDLTAIIQGEQELQKERDALIAESFAKKGKGAQGVQCALALRIATAIREGRSA